MIHYLLRLGACEQMKIFQTEPELYKFGAGWIFGKAVPGSFRLAVDRDVSNLKLSRKLEEIANRDAGTIDTPKCRTVFRDIGVEVLGIAALIGIVPFFIILIAVLVFHFLKRIPGLERRSA